MDKRSKYWVTLTVWVALTAFLIAVIFNATILPEAWMLLPLIMVPLILGIFVTLALWVPAIFPWIDAERLRAMHSEAETALPTQMGKRKRDEQASAEPSQVQVVLSLMDHAERDELKRNLKQRLLSRASLDADGELDYHGLALSDLLDNDQPSSLQERPKKLR